MASNFSPVNKQNQYYEKKNSAAASVTKIIKVMLITLTNGDTTGAHRLGDLHDVKFQIRFFLIHP